MSLLCGIKIVEFLFNDFKKSLKPAGTPQLGFCRGGPMSTGWNSTAAAIVQTRDSAINLPILAMPGWLDSHSPPNAVAVVRALKTTALVRLDCSRPVFPARHAMM